MSVLREFLEAAPPGTEEALAALACAESLTDSVALAIYNRVPVDGLTGEDFVSAFKYSGLTEPRNSEWNLAPALRQELLTSQALEADAKRAVHELLSWIAQDDAKRTRAGSEVPSYLFTEAGLAYHLAGAGDLEAGLKHYSEASRGGSTGAQWLGAKLAEEQERTGVIPKDRVETTFLRALVLWREGHRRDAMPLFRKVAATNLVKREVAISLHIIGNEHNRGQRREAERELRRSIEIGHKLGDQFGVAQRLHSLANLLARQNRPDEAEKAYRQSIEMDGKLGNEFGVAQTLHSLANLLAAQNRADEAEEAYQQSVEIGEKTKNQNHLAQVLRSYALAIQSQEPGRAVLLLERSLEINRRERNTRFVEVVERDLQRVRESARRHRSGLE
jgi:tetratricopeptide (TPR) repeat protein